MTQNITTSALEASGPKNYFFAFSILLDGLARISAIFLLKMQKKSKIGSPYCVSYPRVRLFLPNTTSSWSKDIATASRGYE
jgi:hypothetical protein